MVDKSLLRFTWHARRQMEQRRVSEEEVFIALSDPDEVLPGAHSNETVAVKHFGQRRVRVIYVSEPNQLRVITVTH